MSSQDRRAIFWGAAFIGLAVLYRLVLSPVVDQWREGRASAEAQLVMIEQFENKLEKRSEIRTRLAQRFGPGVHDPLRTADEARIAFPRYVQEAIRRGVASAQKIEVQGVRRVRDVPGVALLSLRAEVYCEPESIPRFLKELGAAEVPVIIESIGLSMRQQGQRGKWRATLLLSTPTLAEEKKP